MRTILSVNWNYREPGRARIKREAEVVKRLKEAGIEYDFEKSGGIGSNKYLLHGTTVPASVKRLTRIVGYYDQQNNFIFPN